MKPALLLRLALLLILPLTATPLTGTRAPQDYTPSESPARSEIERLINQSGADVAVAFRSLDGRQELFLQADEPYEDNNALRLPIMIELYAQAEVGALRLTDTMPVLDRAAAAAGSTVTLRELSEEMIVNNSDPATNRLIERLGLTNIHQRIETLGATGMDIAAPFPKNPENHTSVRAVLILIWSLANDGVVSPDASKEMVSLLSRAHSNADSTAQNSAAGKSAVPTTVHDAVIIFGAHSFAFAIQVRGMADPSAAAEVIAKITHALAAAL
jgi:beta-lactamase family protein